jgi:DNA polymerase sigma
MIMKKLLQKYDLNKSFSGGLNSYSLVLMASTFLENSGSKSKDSIGQNVEQFLNFFGNYFKPLSQGLDGHSFFNLGL